MPVRFHIVRRTLGVLLGVAMLLAPAADALAAQAVVSAFEGSVEMGVYEADFDGILILRRNHGDGMASGEWEID